MLPSFSLPPLECCFGTSPIQAEKSRPDRNAFGSAMLATRAVASAGPTPGISSSRRLVSLERCQAMIRRSNSKILAFQGLHLGAESGNTCACNLGQSFVAFISDDLQQLFDTMASDRCDNPKLGKMGANGIDHRGLLADEQVPGTVQRQAALLPLAFWSPRTACSACRPPHRSPRHQWHRSYAASHRASRRPAASGARCGQGPEVRATNDATRRKLRYQPGTAAPSGRKPECSGASTDGG